MNRERKANKETLKKKKREVGDIEKNLKVIAGAICALGLGRLVRLGAAGVSG